MKYSVEYQHANKGQRPNDPGPVSFQFESNAAGLHLLPNVGDAVSFHSAATEAHGVVRSRYFRFISTADEAWCHVNIVIEEAPDFEWGAVIKE